MNDLSLDIFKPKCAMMRKSSTIEISESTFLSLHFLALNQHLGLCEGFQHASNITVLYEGALQVTTTRVILADGWLASKNRIKIRDLSG